MTSDVVVSPAPGPGERRYFTILPNLIVEDSRLTNADFRLYAYFVRVCGQNGGACFKAATTIAAVTGVSPRQQQESRRHLEELGYVSVNERPGLPVEVRLADVWDDNAIHALGPRQSLPRLARVTSAATAEGSAATAEGGRQSLPTKKKDLRSTEKERDRPGSDMSLIGQLGERLEALGMERYQVDLLFDYLAAKGYSGRDVDWIIRQGLDHNASTPAYYRAIADRESPGVAARASRPKRFPGPEPAAPRVGGPGRAGPPPPPPPPPGRGDA